MTTLRFASSLAASAVLAGLVGCGANKTVDPEEEYIDEPDSGTKSEGGIGDLDVGTGEGGTLPGFTGLKITPTNSIVTIDQSVPGFVVKLPYTASLILENGTEQDVTGETTFDVDATVGGFGGSSTFTSVTTLPGGKLGLTTIVRANASGKSGSTNLTLVQLRKSGPQKDFFFTVPYMADPDPKNDVLQFGTKIKQVDVAFNMDTTASMRVPIDNLKGALSGTLLPNLQASIPNVGMAIVDHRDYPLSACGHGVAGDFPVKVHQVVTTDLGLAKTAAAKYALGDGDDLPESQVPSMMHILTGQELRWQGGSVPQHIPAAGTTGGVDFRAGALAVVVLITDINWHDVATAPYCASVFSPPSIETLKTAFKNANARFVDITKGDETQANQLSDATGSNLPPNAFTMGGCGANQCPTGPGGACRAADGPGGTCRLNFMANSDGSGVDVGIVRAIQAISVGSTFDVTAVASNDVMNEDGVDATQFITALRAMDEGNGADCKLQAAKDTNGDSYKDTFISVVVGTPVCFEVIPKMNTNVKPKTVAQFFNAFIDVLGMPGSVKLDTRKVLFLVPPRDVSVQ